MHSNPSLSLSRRVKQRSLYKHVLLVTHESTPLWLIVAIHFAFKFVHEDSIFVDDGAENQVCCLLLDKFVTISASLIKTGRCAHSEDSLPSATPRQTIVKFVGELGARLIVFIVRVVIETTIRETSDIGQRL